MDYELYEKRVEIINERRQEGKSYAKIGQELGISRQYAHRLACDGLKAYRFRRMTEKNCVFPVLRAWMNKYKVGTQTLAKELGLTYPQLYNKITGKTEFKKSEIDTLLFVTALPYEQIFYGTLIEEKE